jgi:hypothetical protein
VPTPIDKKENQGMYFFKFLKYIDTNEAYLTCSLEYPNCWSWMKMAVPVWSVYRPTTFFSEEIVVVHILKIIISIPNSPWCFSE